MNFISTGDRLSTVKTLVGENCACFSWSAPTVLEFRGVPPMRILCAGSDLAKLRK
jgi:hypothetical protein